MRRACGGRSRGGRPTDFVNAHSSYRRGHRTRRELEEELGVQVKEVAPTLFSVADPGSDFVIEFTPTTIAGEPQPLEHSEVLWAKLADIAYLDLAPSDRRFLEFSRSSPIATGE